MTTIQFKPSAWNGETKNNLSNTYQTAKKIPLKYDSFSFTSDFDPDEILPELNEESLWTKLGKLFAGKKTQSMSNKEALNKANLAYKEALRTKNIVFFLIHRGADEKYKSFKNIQGNRIIFEQDHLGRGVMTELNQEGKPARITTFALTDDLPIYRIEESSSDSSCWNSIVFPNFDNKHVEIKKGIKKGFKKEYIDEIYYYQHAKPASYKKGYARIINSTESSAKEEYYF